MKSRPISIRFDEEKLEFAKEQMNLKSPQAIVDRFLDMLWWRHHLPEIKAQNPLTPDECYTDHQESGEVPKKQAKNDDKTILDKAAILEKIEELKTAANNCKDSRLGKLAKAGYLRDIERLEAKLR